MRIKVETDEIEIVSVWSYEEEDMDEGVIERTDYVNEQIRDSNGKVLLTLTPPQKQIVTTYEIDEHDITVTDVNDDGHNDPDAECKYASSNQLHEEIRERLKNHGDFTIINPDLPYKDMTDD